jgi:hypothetical protein
LKFKNNKPQWLKKYVSIYVDEEINQYGGLGSQTGWIVMTNPSIWNKLLDKEKSSMKRWKKIFHAIKINNIDGNKKQK